MILRKVRSLVRGQIEQHFALNPDHSLHDRVHSPSVHRCPEDWFHATLNNTWAGEIRWSLVSEICPQITSILIDPDLSNSKIGVERLCASMNEKLVFPDPLRFMDGKITALEIGILMYRLTAFGCGARCASGYGLRCILPMQPRYRRSVPYPSARRNFNPAASPL